MLRRAEAFVRDGQGELDEELERRWNSKTKKFVDYWFAPQTQRELLALITEIEKVEEEAVQAFLKVVFSGIIITKSGGVSMALDLAHTRPHRAKIVRDSEGEIILEAKADHISAKRLQILTKTLRSPLEEFEIKLKQNLQDVLEEVPGRIPPDIRTADAQHLPLDEASVDLIVTSPPYAANAIDYMRAHKFSLVWMGYPIGELGQKRKEYIGGEATTGIDYEVLPEHAERIVQDVTDRDEKKGRVLHRYYSEMTRVFREMYRVLKPGAVAIVVVGSSTMRGCDTETEACLAEIGASIGFDVPQIGVRHLDRNRRMMPAGAQTNSASQIQQRMHEEYVIGFYKPDL